MRTVKVEKTQLITVVEENRKKHKVDFEKAEKDYRVALVGLIKDKLIEAKRGDEVSHHLKIEQPTQNLRDYDLVLSMLKMSVDTKVELTAEEFARYARDEWDWKHHSFSNFTALSRMSESYT